MIPGLGPGLQALLGTLLTWGLTAAGSALVFVFSSGQRRILDGSLGFAAGVMLAASYWSLLAPAIELAQESGTFGAFSFFPVAAGFALGAAFVYGADLLLPELSATKCHSAGLAFGDSQLCLAMTRTMFARAAPCCVCRVRVAVALCWGQPGVLLSPVTPGNAPASAQGEGVALTCFAGPSPSSPSSSSPAPKLGPARLELCWVGPGADPWRRRQSLGVSLSSAVWGTPCSDCFYSFALLFPSGKRGRTCPALPTLADPDKAENGEPYQRRRGAGPPLPEGPPAFSAPQDGAALGRSSSWRRILLMILAITIHNIPEGLAVGVGFGAVGKSQSATFQSARNLAIGIGIQNFPEGLAVSLPLRGAGFSTWKAFWYGQLSGMVEPLAGVLGALAVVLAEPLLPYALGFAAGAMVYVVMDDIIPEAQTSGNGKLASWTSILGFVVMMSLDVGLG
ncbi:zinc transporter ZIP11 [Serinus canaria]|uniref:zinc transporter ZIP11 n=1 Tax=Serinus canaria TaxID=9135 RepID=UPI0021CCF6F3|nr:zinc transporter ZIP11 [Serinus canaria]